MKLTVRTLALLCALLLPHAYAAPGNDGESAGKSADVPHASAAGEGAGQQTVLDVYTTVGWVAIGVGIAVLLVSPLIKKLMHLDTLQDEGLAGADELAEPQAAGVHPGKNG